MFDIIIENGYNNFESPFGKMALLHFAQKCFFSFSKIHFPQLFQGPACQSAALDGRDLWRGQLEKLN